MFVSPPISSCARHVAALVWFAWVPSISAALEPPQASSRLPVGNGCSAPVVASADFDGDGQADLAVGYGGDGEFGPNGFRTFLGNGDGTFQFKDDDWGPQIPMGAALSDLDLDGHPDIVATFAWGGFMVWLVRGDGELVRAPGSGDVYPYGRPVCARLNGDAWPDLAAPTPGGVVVGLGNGDGSFGLVQNYATGGHATCVAASDLNADGALDLAVTNEAAAHVSVLFGNGDGTFGQRLDLPAGGSQYAIDVGDLDRDGDPDLVTAYPNLSVFMAKGDGTFQPYHELGAGMWAFDVAIADFDRDGRPDLAAADRQLVVFYADGAGWFEPERRFAAGSFPYSLAVADLDGDQRADVALGDAGSSDVWLVFNPDLTTDAPVPVDRPAALVAVLEPPDGGPVEILARFARPTPAHIAVHDVRGRLLWSWSGDVQAAGERRWTWARRDRAGAGLPRGAYFVQLRTPEATGTRRFVLLHSTSR